MKLAFLCLLAMAFIVPAHAATVCWTLQPAQSHLSFVGDQAGAPANGEFKQFTVDFCLDPATAKGHLRVVVDVASLDTHNSRRDEVLRGKAFFAVKHYPQAVYEAHAFTHNGDGSFTASGTLSVKGKTEPLPVTFTFHQNDATNAVVHGTATIHRLDFDVGTGRWSNTRWVGNDVTLKFDLHLTRKAAAH